MNIDTPELNAAAAHAVEKTVANGAEFFLAEPARFGRLLPTRESADPNEMRVRLSRMLEREKQLARIGHWSSDLNSMLALEQALAATRDPRFPEVWAEHIRKNPVPEQPIVLPSAVPPAQPPRRRPTSLEISFIEFDDGTLFYAEWDGNRDRGYGFAVGERAAAEPIPDDVRAAIIKAVTEALS